MKEVMQTKYVSKRRKETLQMELAAKEVLCLLMHGHRTRAALIKHSVLICLQAHTCVHGPTLSASLHIVQDAYSTY